MFYYADEGVHNFLYERVGGAVPLGTFALDVDLSKIFVESPEIIFESVDGGQNWVSRKCETLNYYAGIQRDWFDDGWYGGFYKESNGAIYSWQYDQDDSLDLEELGLHSLITCLMPDTTSNYLYAAGHEYIYISSNNGSSWSSVQVAAGADIQAIDIRPDNTDYILLADNGGGVYRSTNQGASWNQINSGLNNTHAYCIKYCPEISDIALVGTAGGIFKSTTVNAANPSWFPAGYGAAADTVVAIEFHATDNSIVFRSTKDDGVGKVLISADNARSWIGYQDGLGDQIAYDFASDIDYPDTIYAAADCGIYKTITSISCGEITSNETWGPGLVIVNGDITVDVGDTLKINDSTTVLFIYNFDQEQGGSDSSKCELIIEGTLDAEGTSSDSILFVSSRELIDSASAGDWQGIHFKNGSSGNLEYCAIRDAVIGIEIDSADVNLANCLIKSNDSKAIDGFRAKIDASNCVFDDNPDYAIYSYESETMIDSCEFTDNENYAIYSTEAAPSGYDSTKITNCTFDNHGSIPWGSQYAILIDEVDKSRISDCTIREYNQGGIKLTGADTWINDNNLIRHGIHGIYADSYSDPHIKSCKFDSLSIGVKAAGCSDPFIGRVSSAPVDSGLCNFDGCTDYYIYQFCMASMITVWAEANYFGGKPDTLMFSGGVDYIPYLTSDPLAKLNPGISFPVAIQIHHCFPNPFNPSISISFSLDRPAKTIVAVYNLLGQRVAVLSDKFMAAGEHRLIWDGKNNSGDPVGSGVYFCSIQADENVVTSKMTLLR